MTLVFAVVPYAWEHNDSYNYQNNMGYPTIAFRSEKEALKNAILMTSFTLSDLPKRQVTVNGMSVNIPDMSELSDPGVDPYDECGIVSKMDIPENKTKEEIEELAIMEIAKEFHDQFYVVTQMELEE